ncbi:MAG: restriction endonuclease subunit S [Anaerovibrio sp.]|nr:restriction endonuclease subunit S [Anaerovibrio sp.]
MIDVSSLKQKIIDYATSGKLSSVCNDDENIEIVLSKLPTISSKREKLLEHSPEYDEKYTIPHHWRWVRLGEISTYGDTPNKVKPTEIKDGTWLLELEDIEVGGMLLAKKRYSIRKSVGEKTVFKKGQILYSKLRPYLKKVLIADEDGVSTPELISFEVMGGIDARYITYCLVNSYVYKVINKRSYGIKMPRVDVGFMVNLPIPLPPINEQKRIVERVDEIFKLLDKIDTLQGQYQNDLEVLKSKIIDAGIRGQLTEQLPEDGTAEELYQAIQAEKAKLIKEKKIKKEKPMPEITAAEIPFEIPDNWKWVRWGDISQSIKYGYNAPALENGRIKMVRISDIQANEVLWENVPYCDIDEDSIEVYSLQPNDILFARTGGTVGKSYLVEEVPEEAVYAGYLIRTRYSSLLSPRYLKYFMQGSLYWSQLRNGTIATAQPNCNGKTLGKMIVPLPPLSEQKRIVAKIDSVLGAIGK